MRRRTALEIVMRVDTIAVGLLAVGLLLAERGGDNAAEAEDASAANEAVSEGFFMGTVSGHADPSVGSSMRNSTEQGRK